MKHYGIPYMGSKEKMLKHINIIFEREHDKEYFIDPFCGGFCVSAYVLENTKFKVLANDLSKYVIALYKEMLFNSSKEFEKVWFDWVSRDTFMDVKKYPEKYPDWYVGYVLTIWSFGNNQKRYLFGKHIEELKKEAHDFLMENGYKMNKLLRLPLIKQFKEKAAILGRLNLQQLQQLERLELLNRDRLVRLDCIDWAEFINSIPKDIIKNSFIYCDPPYENTEKYQAQNQINYKRFWDWFKECPYPVYVSSYKAPYGIEPMLSVKKREFLSNRKNLTVENIYFNGKE